MEIIQNFSKKRFLTVKQDGDSACFSSFKQLAIYLTQEYPDEAEQVALVLTQDKVTSPRIQIKGFDSESKTSLAFWINKSFVQENDPCSESYKEEW